MSRTAVIAMVVVGAMGAFGYWFFLAPGSPPSGREVPLPLPPPVDAAVPDATPPAARGFLIVQVDAQLIIDPHRDRDRYAFRDDQLLTTYAAGDTWAIRWARTWAARYGTRTDPPVLVERTVRLAVPATGDQEYDVPLEGDWHLLVHTHGWRYVSDTEVQVDGRFQSNISVSSGSTSYGLAARPLGAVDNDQATYLAGGADDTGTIEIDEFVRFSNLAVTLQTGDPGLVLGRPFAKDELGRRWDEWRHIDAFALELVKAASGRPAR